MLRFAIWRLAAAIPLLLATSFIVFSLMHVAPGSPEHLLLQGRQATPETLAAIRAQYHLDEPFLAQYWHWLTGVVHGDFGDSIAFNAPVSELVWPRVVPTLELALYAVVLVAIGGLAIGTGAALLRNRTAAGLLGGVALVGSTISAYVSGIVLVTIFGAALGWFPIFGLGGPGLDRVYHLTLPAVALAIALIALVARTTQVSVMDVRGQDYVLAARSRGYSSGRVVGKHVMRNAMVPVVTITGLVFGFLIAGTVLVEYTFGLDGLGGLLVRAVQSKDFPVVQAVTLVAVGGFVVINTIVDLCCFAIDPRIRAGSGAK